MSWVGMKRVLWLSVMVGVTTGLWTLLSTSPPANDPMVGAQVHSPRTKAEMLDFLSRHTGSAEDWLKLARWHKDDNEFEQATRAFAAAEQRLLDDLSRPARSAEESTGAYIASRWHTVGWCRIETGQMDEARRAFLEATVIMEAECRVRATRRSLYNLACYASMAGEHELAVESFARAIDAGWENHYHASRDKDLDPIRDDPRFGAQMDRIDPEVASRPQGG